MKIIEALKEIPLIDKKIDKNTQQLTLYSAAVDNGNVPFAFDTAEKQKQEVDALVQSTNDLVSRRAKLRRWLSVTNSRVKVTIGGEEKTISEWIEYRQYGFDKLIQSYSALNDQKARSDMQRVPVDATTGIKVVRFYDEKDKNQIISKYMEMREKVSPTLEIVNATTDLIED